MMACAEARPQACRLRQGRLSGAELEPALSGGQRSLRQDGAGLTAIHIRRGGSKRAAREKDRCGERQKTCSLVHRFTQGPPESTFLGSRETTAAPAARHGRFRPSCFQNWYDFGGRLEG